MAWENPGFHVPTQGLIIRDRWMYEAVPTADCAAGAYPGPVLPEVTNQGSISAFAEGVPDESDVWADPANKALDLFISTGGGLTGAQDYGGAGYVRRVRGEGDAAWCGLNALSSFVHGVSVGSDAPHYAGAVVYSQRFGRLIVARVVNSSTVRLHVVRREHCISDPDNWDSLDIEVEDAKGPSDPSAQDTGMAMCETPDGALLMALNVYRGGLNDLDLYLSTDGGDTWEVVHRSLLATTIGHSSDAGRPSAQTWAVCTMVSMACSGDYVRLFFTGYSMGGAFLGLTQSPCTLVSPDRGASWRAIVGGVTVDPLTGADFNPTRRYRAMAGTDTHSGTFLLVVPGDTNGRVYHSSSMGGWSEVPALELDWSAAVGGGADGECLATWLTRDPDRIWLHALLQNMTSGAIELHAWVIDPANPLDPASWTWWGAIERYSYTGVGTPGLPETAPYNTSSVWADDCLILYGALVDPTLDATPTSSPGCLLLRAGQWERAPWAPTKNPHGARSTTWWRTADVMALYFVGTGGDSAQPCEGWSGWMGDPDATGHTYVGTATVTTDPDRVIVSKAASDATIGYFQFPRPLHLISPYADEAAGALHVIAQVASSSATTGVEHAGIKIVIGNNWTNGTPDHGANVTIRMALDSYVVWDNVAAAPMHSGSYPPGAKIEWRVGFVSPTRFEVRWRVLAGGTRSDGPWQSTGILEAQPYNGSTDHVHVGILTAATHASEGTEFRLYEYRVRAGNPWGQAPAGDTLPRDLLGAPLTRGGIHAANGLRITWGGSGAFAGDAYTATVDHTRGPENLLLDSPRLMWESDTVEECGPVLQAGVSPTLTAARWEIDAIALFGTVDRTAKVQFANANTPAAWASPDDEINLSADLYTGLFVAETDGSAVRLVGDLPARGEAIGLYLRITTGPLAGHTHRIYQDPGRTDGWFQLEGEASAEIYDQGTAAVIYGDRMAWSGPRKRYRYLRILFPDVSGVPDVIVRDGARPGGTPTGTHRLGSVLPGTWLPFAVPMDWAFSDDVDPNVRGGRTDSGVTWEHVAGPPARTITGRIVGDVAEFRRTLRRLLDAHQGYSAAPAGLILDANRLTPENLLLVRWRSASRQDEAAWYQDADGNWRTAGDADVICEEIV